MEKIFVVLVNRNEKHTTLNSLKDLIKQQGNFLLKIVVVDNASTDGSAKEIKKFGHGIIPVFAQRNLGFAKGANLGIRYALSQKASRVLLLNPDTKFGTDLIQKLLVNRSDIVAPVIKYQKGKKWLFDFGGTIDWRWGRAKHTENEVVNSKDQKNNFDYLSGCCLLIKTKVFDGVGLFDENFFLYFEDVDFCLRARKAGFSLAMEKDVCLTHFLKGAQQKATKPPVNLYYNLQSNLRFILKYQRGTKLLASLCYLFVLAFKVLLNQISAYKINSPAGGRNSKIR